MAVPALDHHAPPPAPVTDRSRCPLSSRLDDEWRRLRRHVPVVARARLWGVTAEPFDDLNQLLVLAGWRVTPSMEANGVLGRLVDVAHHDELAARVVLQRILPGLLAIVRRRHRHTDPDGTFEELVGEACLTIHRYRTDLRPERIASNLVRDAGHRTFTAPRRRLSWTEVSIDPHALDETPAVVVVSSCEELATLLADARAAGIDQRDLELIRQLLQHGSATVVAAERKVTPRTVRNHRDRTARRLREVALAA